MILVDTVSRNVPTIRTGLTKKQVFKELGSKESEMKWLGNISCAVVYMSKTGPRALVS